MQVSVKLNCNATFLYMNVNSRVAHLNLKERLLASQGALECGNTLHSTVALHKKTSHPKTSHRMFELKKKSKTLSQSMQRRCDCALVMFMRSLAAVVPEAADRGLHILQQPASPG